MLSRKTRGAAGRAAAEKRAGLLRREVAAIPVVVSGGDPLTLRTRAIDAYNARSREGHASVDSEPHFLDRIVVNYLRHECSDYDALLAWLGGRVGVREAEHAVRGRVYDEIARAHPVLAAECARQEERRASQTSGIII